jgi:5-methyltetrahydrofolate--homocysteine methyltransferase
MPRDERLYNAILRGDRNTVSAVVREKLSQSVPVGEILDDSMIPAMRETGHRFTRGEVYVPEMLISARAMQTGLDLIEPFLADSGREPRGRVAIGTVRGDLHDIGKNLVAIMLKGAGFAVDDLGADCSVEKFAAAVERGSQVVCLSALLTTTMPYMKAVVRHFAGNEAVKVIVGGAPVTAEYAGQIGAHGYGADASQAVEAVERCLELES